MEIWVLSSLFNSWSTIIITVHWFSRWPGQSCRCHELSTIILDNWPFMSHYRTYIFIIVNIDPTLEIGWSIITLIRIIRVRYIEWHLRLIKQQVGVKFSKTFFIVLQLITFINISSIFCHFDSNLCWLPVIQMKVCSDIKNRIPSQTVTSIIRKGQWVLLFVLSIDWWCHVCCTVECWSKLVVTMD